ncbi:MAG TPA: peptide chain release factor 2 [Deltaproteobacteria bacterium]|nr:peptide chain release factor 2 [Deltaproteobacteria bacterium]
MSVNSASAFGGCERALTSSGGVFDVEGLRARLDELENEMARPDLWDDREVAEDVGRKKNAVERELALHDRVELALDDAEILLELAEEAGDAEAIAEVIGKCDEVSTMLEEAELKQLLGGEHDAANAILSINAGAGGTDACDWAEMLLRMYLRWAERHDFRTEILDIQAGEEAGIRGVTLRVEGEYAYGYLNSEQGVHRLVRISPFDSNARRHTAFASVTAVPEIDDSIEIEIDESDLRIDTYRSSGAGGQHVNKTDSAVRLTHLPTNIVAQCQNERSQHKNKATAMKILRAKLYELERREQQARLEELTGEKREIGFGSQIRSYTLHPQQRAKDHRTDLEIGNVEAVLDGDIDAFIRANLLAQGADVRTNHAGGDVRA